MSTEVKQAAVNPLTEALLDILQKVTTGVEEGVSFLSAQLPDVINQLLMWKLVQSGVIAVVCLAFCITCIWLCFKALKSDGNEPALIFLVPGILVSGGFSVTHFLMMLKIWIAPKIFLIEYAAQLVR